VTGNDGPPCHPEIAETAFLLGQWQGSGVGDYPTIEGFEYLETATFGHVGKPFISYGQKTRRANTETPEPLHAEAGYFRPTGSGTLEFVVAQPSGILEIHTGTVAGTSIRLRSVSVVTSPTAKEVATVERSIEVIDDVMRYSLFMGAVGEPHQIHLRGELRRVSEGR